MSKEGDDSVSSVNKTLASQDYKQYLVTKDKKYLTSALQKLQQVEQKPIMAKTRFAMLKLYYLMHKASNNFCHAKKYRQQLLSLVDEKKEEVGDFASFHVSFAELACQENVVCQDCGTQKLIDKDAILYLRKALSNGDGKQLSSKTRLKLEVNLFRILETTIQSFLYPRADVAKEMEVLAIKIVSNPLSRDLFGNTMIGLSLFNFLNDNGLEKIAFTWLQKCINSGGKMAWAMYHWGLLCLRYGQKDNRLLDPNIVNTYVGQSLVDTGTSTSARSYFEVGLCMLHQAAVLKYRQAADYLWNNMSYILLGCTSYDATEDKHIPNHEYNFELLLCYIDDGGDERKGVQKFLLSVAKKYNYFSNLTGQVDAVTGKYYVPLIYNEEGEKNQEKIYDFILTYGFDWRPCLDPKINPDHESLAKRMKDSKIEERMEQAYQDIVTCPHFPTGVSQIISSYLPWSLLLKKQGQKIN